MLSCLFLVCTTVQLDLNCLLSSVDSSSCVFFRCLGLVMAEMETVNLGDIQVQTKPNKQRKRKVEADERWRWCIVLVSRKFDVNLQFVE